MMQLSLSSSTAVDMSYGTAATPSSALGPSSLGYGRQLQSSSPDYAASGLPLSTPPLSGSPLDLPPILDLSTSIRPPTPVSADRQGKANEGAQVDEPVTPRSSLPGLSSVERHLSPPFLEPTPQLDNHHISHYESAFRPHLFSALKEKFDRREPRQRKWSFFTHHKIPSLQIPVPRRSSANQQPLPSLQPRPEHEINKTSNNKKAVVNTADMQYSPMSPTMASASAAAAAAAVQHHPGSTVAESFLNCLRLSSLRTSSDSATPPPCSLSSSSSTNDTSSDDEVLLTEEQDEATRMAAEALAAASADAHHRAAQEQHQRNNSLVSLLMQHKRRSGTSSGIDHTKFLTKNAHIKRPRNAWIHFRCHYGQALKTQDPTLRAEEISKRASRRWARLTESEKKPWHDLAEQEKLAHKEAFPEYRYCPKRHSSSSSSSTASSSSLSSPSPTGVPNSSGLLCTDIAESQSGGDTGGHRYKKARRRTK